MTDELDNALVHDLEAFMAGEETYAPVEDDDRELTTASLDDRANWTLRRIRFATRELARIGRTADAERARIDAWAEDRSRGPRALIEKEAANLEEITRRLVGMSPERKTISLPNGTVRLREPGQPSLVVDDEVELIAWLEEHHPDLVETTTVKKTAKANVKKIAGTQDMSGDETEGADPAKKLMWAVDPATGETIPGVHLETPAQDTFSYQTETDTPSA